MLISHFKVNNFRLLTPRHSIILEEASLELVPAKFQRHRSCKLIENRSDVQPELQILDDNYHHEIISKLPDSAKRGRPDIVHFALLDIVSTPAYMEDLVEVYVHTVNDVTIRLKSGVRLPRSFERFCGVIAKLLSGKLEDKEMKLFEIRDETIESLISSIHAERVVCLTSEGLSEDIVEFARGANSGEGKAVWIIGGFARGHFDDSVKSLASDIISISNHSLAAQVICSRLCFAIEKACH